MKMTTEQVFDGLWSLFYTLETTQQRNKFEQAAKILAELFPEEKWDNE